MPLRVKCPICNDLLVFPRNDSAYCEECGWPDEDFNEEYKYFKEGDRISGYAPGLEFFDGKKWILVERGDMIIVSKKFNGLYRMSLKMFLTLGAKYRSEHARI